MLGRSAACQGVLPLTRCEIFIDILSWPMSLAVTPGRRSFKSQYILQSHVLAGLRRCGHDLLCNLPGQVRIENGGPLFKNYEDFRDSDKQSKNLNPGLSECGGGCGGSGWGSMWLGRGPRAYEAGSAMPCASRLLLLSCWPRWRWCQCVLFPGHGFQVR